MMHASPENLSLFFVMLLEEKSKRRIVKMLLLLLMESTSKGKKRAKGRPGIRLVLSNPHIHETIFTASGSSALLVFSFPPVQSATVLFICSMYL